MVAREGSIGKSPHQWTKRKRSFRTWLVVSILRHRSPWKTGLGAVDAISDGLFSKTSAIDAHDSKSQGKTLAF
jgi:hypothetical protein